MHQAPNFITISAFFDRLSGNAGSGVAAGSNRLVTWNAGADWAGQISANVKFRLNVTDAATPPAPDGFALISGGEWFACLDGGESPGAFDFLALDAILLGFKIPPE